MLWLYMQLAGVTLGIIPTRSASNYSNLICTCIYTCSLANSNIMAQYAMLWLYMQIAGVTLGNVLCKNLASNIDHKGCK